MRTLLLAAPVLALATSAFAGVEARQTPFNAKLQDAVELKNDSFVDQGGQAYLQMGFVEGEKAGVWVQVPAAYPKFKIDYFRVLMGNGQDPTKSSNDMLRQSVFFTMGVAAMPSVTMPADIENAADVTPGNYWNDIPAMADQGKLACANAGEFIGAALEFAHTGLPSIYRDLDGLSNAKYNTLFAIPGGWNYSVAYGLRGDWLLRVVGHAAAEGECD